MEFPTVDSVIDLHHEILVRTGGTPGILNLGAVDSALYRAQWGPFFGDPDLATRAAFLLRGLCQDHPFADGNKRTAYEATDLLLRKNGHQFVAAGDEFVQFMVQVAQDQHSLDSITRWIRTHSQTMKSRGGE